MINVVHMLVALLQVYGIREVVSTSELTVVNELLLSKQQFKLHTFPDAEFAANAAVGLAQGSQQPVVLCRAQHKALSLNTGTSPTAGAVLDVVLGGAGADQSGQTGTSVVLMANPKSVREVESTAAALNRVLFNAKYVGQSARLYVPQFTAADVEISGAFSFGYIKYCDHSNVQNLAITGTPQLRAGVFIGNNVELDQGTSEALATFVVKHGMPVFCEASSPYHGPNRIMLESYLTQAPKRKSQQLQPQLLVDLGGTCSLKQMAELFVGTQVIQVSPAGTLQERGELAPHVACVPTMLVKLPVKEFVAHLSSLTSFVSDHLYYTQLQAQRDEPSHNSKQQKQKNKPLTVAALFNTLNAILAKRCNVCCVQAADYAQANHFTFQERVNVEYLPAACFEAGLSKLVGYALADSQHLTFGVIHGHELTAEQLALLPKNLRLLVLVSKDPVHALQAEHCLVAMATNASEFREQIVAFCHRDYATPAVLVLKVQAKAA